MKCQGYCASTWIGPLRRPLFAWKVPVETLLAPPCRYSTEYLYSPGVGGMNLMRKALPSSESQNPATRHFLFLSAFSSQPVNSVSMKGFWAWGQETLAVTSTKSCASMLSADCENETCKGVRCMQPQNKTQWHTNARICSLSLYRCHTQFMIFLRCSFELLALTQSYR